MLELEPAEAKLHETKCEAKARPDLGTKTLEELELQIQELLTYIGGSLFCSFFGWGMDGLILLLKKKNRVVCTNNWLVSR